LVSEEHDRSYRGDKNGLQGYGFPVHVEDFGERGKAAYHTDPDANVVEFWTWDVAERLRKQGGK
jgi:hypothetical protein